MSRVRNPRRPLIPVLGALVALAFAVGVKAADGPDSKLAKVQSEHLQPPWGALQFVGADKQGRVILLRSDTLELFRVTLAGKLRPLGKLGARGGDSPAGSVNDAVMSAAGDTWLLVDFANGLHLFRSGEEKALAPTTWTVSAIALSGGTPVLGLRPGQMGGPEATRSRPKGTPPFLLRLGTSGSGWETLVEGAFFKRETPEARFEEFLARTEMRMAADPQGGVWVADRNAYRLRHFTAQGKLRSELVVGTGRVEWAKRTAEDWDRLRKLAQEEGLASGPSGLGPLKHQSVFRGLTVGRDGSIYAAVDTKHGLALDRFDPALQKLERVLLAGVEPDPGALTLAAGRDALYLAARTGRDGLWRIAWEELADATWKPVPDATLDGQPLFEEEKAVEEKKAPAAAPG